MNPAIAEETKCMEHHSKTVFTTQTSVSFPPLALAQIQNQTQQTKGRVNAGLILQNHCMFMFDQATKLNDRRLTS